MDFPRYTRDENLKCKLTDIQIKEIKERRERGESYTSIASEYDITPQTVYYWCLSEAKRKEKNHAHYESTKERGIRYENPNYHKKYRQRKKVLRPEFSDYELFSSKRYRQIYPEQAKESGKKSNAMYRLKNKERIKAYQKQYQRTHLDKFREYNRKSREKKKTYDHSHLTGVGAQPIKIQPPGKECRTEVHWWGRGVNLTRARLANTLLG
ncbi:MAG: hypothetical protein U1A23_04645 [Candidatus Sungbacteria bacterium]|nr:hypothetical protein [Candidatus Sungbacteria bacterium]